jgi:hypothetical protein
MKAKPLTKRLNFIIFGRGTSTPSREFSKDNFLQPLEKEMGDGRFDSKGSRGFNQGEIQDSLDGGGDFN